MSIQRIKSGVIADSAVTAAKLDDSTSQLFGFRNRIINGDFRIDQRNAGASVTPTVSATYTLDRWNARLSVASKFSVQQNAGSVTPPAGFVNYLGCTSLSAYTVGSSETFTIQQIIEGLNCSDLAWGTANAKTVTLSFQVYSSLTGTFGGTIQNSASNRSYPFSYTVSAANTWEQKSVTIPGDTTGTWLTTNGIGIRLNFSLGTGSSISGTAGAWSGSNLFSATGATSVVGTNGATFYVTGVQLEVGSVATPFERRPYGTELALCQRYFCKSYNIETAVGTATATGQTWFTSQGDSANVQQVWPVYFPVTMRAAPTVTIYNPATGGTASLRDLTDGANIAASAESTSISFNGFTLGTAAAGLTVNQKASFHWASAIEL